jgi:hypothetical protein
MSGTVATTVRRGLVKAGCRIDTQLRTGGADR